MKRIRCRCRNVLILVVLAAQLVACGSSPATSTLRSDGKPLPASPATSTSAPSEALKPSTSATASTASPGPTTAHAIGSATVAASEFVVGQQVATKTPVARDLWSSAADGERVAERPKLYGGAIVTITAITPTSVRVRTPEGVEGWIREPAEQALTTDLVVEGERARFDTGVQVQIIQPSGVPLREAPSSQARKLHEQLAAGQQGMLQEVRGDWLKLLLDDGSAGWARWYYDDQRYIAPMTAQAEAGSPVPQPPTSSTATVSGNVAIAATRTIPRDAVLVIQLQAWADSRLGGPSVMDAQVIPSPGPGPYPFALAYQPAQVADHMQMLGTYEIYAELRAPGRVPWIVTSPVSLQAPPAPVDLLLQSPTHVGTITGSVTVPDVPALPPNAELTIRLVPDTGFDPVGVGRLTFKSVKRGSIPFLLEYPALAISVEQHYFVHAEVRTNGRLPLTTPLYPVLTHGHPAQVDAVLAVPSELRTVRGNVQYPQADIPAEAVLTVRVIDITGADGPEVVLAQQTLAPGGAGPVPFALEFDPVLIEPRRSYAVYGRITAGEQVVFSSDTLYSVLTEGASTTVDVILKPLR